MDNTSDKTKIELELETLADLDRIRKWTMFLAVLGFIGTGVLLIVGIITGVFLTVFNKGNTSGGFPGWLVIVIIIAASAIYFLPLLYMFRFSRFISNVVKNKNSEELRKAFRNLRSYFTYIGVIVIVLLVIYVIAVIVMGSSIDFLKDLG